MNRIAKAVERGWNTVTLPNKVQQHGHWRDVGQRCASAQHVGPAQR